MSDVTASEWKNVTRSHLCAVCGKPDWCSYTLDGAMAMCRRIPSQRQTPSGAWLHTLRDAPAARPLPPPPVSVAARLFSASSYYDRLPDDRVMADGLAVSLGLDVATLDRLGARYDRFNSAYAFPMRDGEGRMVGIRLRSTDGRKWAVTHSKAGLFYEPAVTTAQEVWICEGPTDAAAVMSLGHVAIGRPSCLGGVHECATRLTKWDTRRIVCVADNDSAKRRPDGSVWYPGREGAQALVAALGREYKMLMTPTKDIRAWVAGGATRRDVDEVVRVLKWRKGGQ